MKRPDGTIRALCAAAAHPWASRPGCTSLIAKKTEPTMSILRMSDLDLAGKRVLIREDLNVPIEGGRITSEQRIVAALPTMKLALSKGAAVMVTSHLGRPKEGTWTQ